MFGLPYRVLFISLFLIPPIAFCEFKESICHVLFDLILEQEPYLEKELKDLQYMCIQDIKNNGVVYWSCVSERMKQGQMSFERFILSDQVCRE
jgi:hypothetical protein